MQAARGALELARIEERALREEIRAEIESARARFQAAEKAVGTARRGLRAARRAHRVHLERFRTGTALGLEVLEAQNALAQAKQALAEATAERDVALLELAAAWGWVELLYATHPAHPAPGTNSK